MSAVDVTMCRELAVAIIPDKFSVANIQGEVIAELVPNRFANVTVVGYSLFVYSRPNTRAQHNKGERELVWNPTEESVLKLVRELELNGSSPVRRSARLMDSEGVYVLLDTPYVVQIAQNNWEVTFYYQEEE